MLVKMASKDKESGIADSYLSGGLLGLYGNQTPHKESMSRGRATGMGAGIGASIGGGLGAVMGHYDGPKGALLGGISGALMGAGSGALSGLYANSALRLHRDAARARGFTND